MEIITPGLWAIMPACAIALIIMWCIFGKDRKTIPVITTRPPGGLDPLEMEFAQIATITDRGIYAEILQWVSKDVLKIREEDGRIGIQRIAQLPEDAPEHASFLFEGLFRKSDLIWLDDIPSEVSDHKDKLLELVSGRFKGRNAVVQNDTMIATIAGMALLIIAVFFIEVTLAEANVGVLLAAFLGVALFVSLTFLQNGALGFRTKHDRFEVIAGAVSAAVILIIHFVFLLFHTDNWLFIAVFCACYLICIPCILFMERRVNYRLYGQILGFREFIETAEWHKLKQLSEEDPDYGIEILPYAMLFNMGTRWTARFENKTIISCVEKMEVNSGQQEP